MNVDDAKKELKGFELEFSGTGNKISYQSPEAGTRVLEGTSIRLLLTEQRCRYDNDDKISSFNDDRFYTFFNSRIYFNTNIKK